MTSRFVLPLADVGRGITPNDGAKLFFFVVGTSNKKATYSDSTAMTKNANPVIADGNGVFPQIWIKGSYKVVLKTKNNKQIWEQDPVLEGSVSPVINVADHGAVGDGVTDDTQAFIDAFVAANGSRVQCIDGATHAIAGTINGPAESITDIFLDMNSATIVFDVTGGAFNWLVDIDKLKIVGPGQIGNNAQELTGDFQTIYYTQNTSTLDISSNVDFQAGSLQYRAIKSEGGFGPTTCIITKANFRNFVRYGIDLPVDNKGDNEAFYCIGKCKFKNIGTVEASPHRAIRIGSNDDDVEACFIYQNRFFDITSGNSDANAILIYGNSVVIDGNFVDTVNNTKLDDAEAIYVKATNFKIINNHVLNGGNSHDGCIGVKGNPWPTSGQYSQYGVIAHNTVEIDDLNVDVPAITINRSMVNVHDNILTDLRSNRSGKDFSIAIGLGTSNPVSNVNCHHNTITGFQDYFGHDDTSNVDVRAQIVDNVKINYNICTRGDGGYGMSYRCDAKSVSDMVFDAAADTITLTQAGRFWDYNLYRVGDGVTFSSTVSNNSAFVITAVTELVLTVASGITDETVSQAQAVRNDADGFEFNNNVIAFETQGAFGLRARGGNPKNVSYKDNIFDNVNYVGRFDSGTIGVLKTADNVNRNIGTDEFQNAVAATVFIRRESGTGTPEANVVGGIGSTFQRDDGGAGTSLYVKETGTAKTGWVGK